MTTLQRVLNSQEQANEARRELAAQMIEDVPARLRPLLQERLGLEGLESRRWFLGLLEGDAPTMGVSLCQAKRFGWESLADLRTELLTLNQAWYEVLEIEEIKISRPNNPRRSHLKVIFTIAPCRD
ncbi:MAG: hypothetical protein WC702_03875 [Patescibacteria group bacterium]|jgi:hypothetical protein